MLGKHIETKFCRKHTKKAPNKIYPSQSAPGLGIFYLCYSEITFSAKKTARALNWDSHSMVSRSI